MKKQLLDLLACPNCRGDLDLHVKSGTQEYIEKGDFTCKGCSVSFPIENDIPFFKREISHKGIKNQFVTYSAWWDKFHDENYITDPAHAEYFYNSLQIAPSEFKGKVILDAGCGNGRFSYVVSFYQPQFLVSFDISSGLVHAQKAIQKYNPNAQVAYVQGDITSPPFKKEAFDIVYSWGVLHHTPNTKKSFLTVSELVKIEGKLGVYIYEFHPLYNYNKHALSLLAYIRSLFFTLPMRAMCSKLPVWAVKNLFVPIYWFERLTGLGIFGCHGPKGDRYNKSQYFRVVIDRFKTRYASEHQFEEVVNWFTKAKFQNLIKGFYPQVSMIGQKQKDEVDTIRVSCQLKSRPLPAFESAVPITKRS